MNRNHLVISLLFAAIVFGCSPKMYPTEIRDSVRVEIRERVIHDSVFLEIEKQVEKIATRDTLSHLENDYAESDAVVSGGILHHSLSSRPQRIYVPYTVTVHDTTTVEHQADTIIKEIPAQFTKWQSFSMVLGWILGGFSLVAATIFVALKMTIKK